MATFSINIPPALDKFYVGEESPQGTAATTYDHRFSIPIYIKPQAPPVMVAHSDGSIGQNSQSEIIREWGEVSGAGAATVDDVYWALKLLGGPEVSDSPAGGILTTSYIPEIANSAFAYSHGAYTMLAANEAILAPGKSGTLGLFQTLSFSNDAGGSNVAQLSVAGVCRYPETIDLSTYSSYTLPSVREEKKFSPLRMTAWLDTTSAIGTTEMIGHVVRAQHTLTSPWQQQFRPVGDSDANVLGGYGRQRRVGITTQVTIRQDGTIDFEEAYLKKDCKLRVRHYAYEITTGVWAYVSFSTYGKMSNLNRRQIDNNSVAWDFTISGEVDTGIGSDAAVSMKLEEFA